MSDGADDVFEHRLNQLEARSAEILAGVNKVLALEIHHSQTRKDVDSAHELLRAHDRTNQLLMQQVGRIEHASEAIRQSVRALSEAVNDPTIGIAVRMSKLESMTDNNRQSIRYMTGIWVGIMLSSMGFVLKWAWDKLLGPLP